MQQYIFYLYYISYFKIYNSHVLIQIYAYLKFQPKLRVRHIILNIKLKLLLLVTSRWRSTVYHDTGASVHSAPGWDSTGNYHCDTIGKE